MKTLNTTDLDAGARTLGHNALERTLATGNKVEDGYTLLAVANVLSNILSNILFPIYDSIRLVPCLHARSYPPMPPFGR